MLGGAKFPIPESVHSRLTSHSKKILKMYNNTGGLDICENNHLCMNHDQLLLGTYYIEMDDYTIEAEYNPNMEIFRIVTGEVKTKDRFFMIPESMGKHLRPLDPPYVVKPCKHRHNISIKLSKMEEINDADRRYCYACAVYFWNNDNNENNYNHNFLRFCVYYSQFCNNKSGIGLHAYDKRISAQLNNYENCQDWLMNAARCCVEDHYFIENLNPNNILNNLKIFFSKPISKPSSIHDPKIIPTLISIIDAAIIDLNKYGNLWPITWRNYLQALSHMILNVDTHNNIGLSNIDTNLYNALVQLTNIGSHEPNFISDRIYKGYFEHLFSKLKGLNWL